MHTYSFNDLKFILKLLKTLLHVSIIRSSSGTIHCSFLKEQCKLLEDDPMIETCRSVFKCFNLNFRSLNEYMCICWCSN